jgi:hypothetical protein
MTVITYDFGLNNLKTSHIQKEGSMHLAGGVLINLSEIPIQYADLEIIKNKSAAVQNIAMDIENALFFEWGNINPLENTTCSDPTSIQNMWNHVYDIFEVDTLKNTPLWRSKQFSIGEIDINLWFCPPDTNCGIHNEHDFHELHTQIFGLGIMQKFGNNDYKSKYEDVLMPYGYTHPPFYKENYYYPWHQYKSITDCIWVALEFNRK